MNNMKTITKKSVRKIRDRVHYYLYIHPLKHSLAEDLQKKRIKITEKLTKEDVKNISSLWHPFNGRFDWDWFALYKSINISGGGDLSLYIPDDFYYMYVDSFFANRKDCIALDDKNLYDLLFHDVPQPRTIARRIGGVYLTPDYSKICFDEFVRLCAVEKKVVLKKSIDSNGGKGILFFDIETDPVEKLKDWIMSKDNIVVQEAIKQHPELDRLHPQSINTIRIITFVFGEVHVLSSVLRMGVGGALVDNASSGGIVCGILPSGRLKPEAFDVNANRYESHPSGVRLEEISIPNFNCCLELCKRLALRLVQFSKLISWDIAINREGTPILVETNMSWGELDFHQMCNGPIFGELTPDVLNYLFENNKFLFIHNQVKK